MQLYNVSTPYIMKADDDNFVRLDAVLDELHFASHTRGLYMGNINEFHKPLREGKWAVTEEVRVQKIFLGATPEGGGGSFCERFIPSPPP